MTGFEIAAFIGKNRNRSAVIPAQAGIRLVRFRFFLRFRATSKPSFPRRRESRPLDSGNIQRLSESPRF
ncbi:hypothetical protein A6J49_14085 [Neisseria meningitidis]|nr:hypothetical protein A6J49_14085 [Neisseria meningitidis]